MASSSFLFIGSLIFCLFNIGMIWTIQVVHYPGFLYLSPDQYTSYQFFHMSAITRLVAVSMLGELIFALGTVLVPIPASGYLVPTSLVLLILIFLHTAFIASPIHGQLTAGYDEALIRKLIRTNWARTLLWTLRGFLLTLLLVKSFKN